MKGPGGYLSGGNRLAALLAQQPDMNNGSHAGGLASALRQGLMGLMAGNDRRESEGAQATLAQALTAMQGTPESSIQWNQPTRPDGTGAPTTAVPAQPGNRGLAMQLLASNPRTAPMGMEMANADMQFQRQREAAQADREAEIQARKDLATYQADLAAKKPVTVGRSLVDPVTGQPIYTAPADPTSTPSSVAEWQFYNSLPPEAQDRYLLMKRANPPLNVGSGFVVPSPTNPGQTQGGYTMGVAPSQKVDNGRVVTLPGVPGGAPMGQSPAPWAGGATPPPMDGAPAPAGPTAQPGMPSVTDLPMTPKDQKAENNRQQQQKTMADIVGEDINRAIGMIDKGFATTGAPGAVMSSIPGTDANDMSALIDTIGANIGFDQLSQMRAASPTGGALGSVTEREMTLLQSVKGAIRQSQSKDQLRYNLQRYYNTLMDAVHGSGGGPQRFNLEGGGGGGWSARKVQ